MDLQTYSELLYTEINIIGILFATLILIQTGKKASAIGRTGLHFFRLMLTANIFILLCDTGILLMRGKTSVAEMTVTHVFCVLYFLSQCFLSYSWIRYCIAILFPGRSTGRIQHTLLLIPALLYTAMAITSPWTGWMYELRQDNHYVRGSLMALGLVLLYSYWVISSAMLIWKKEHFKKGKETPFYRSLLLFPLPVVIGNVLQMLFYGLPIGWICSVFSLLLVFLNIQTIDGSIDGQTGMLSKTHGLNVLNEILKKQNQTVFVLMIDIDNFKFINDHYGHLLGDQALSYFSNLLTERFKKKKHLCRYGGDEILIFGYIKSVAEVDNIKEGICEALDKLNGDSLLPFPLSVSIGFAVKDAGSTMSTNAIIECADQDMYRYKNAKKHID